MVNVAFFEKADYRFIPRKFRQNNPSIRISIQEVYNSNAERRKFTKNSVAFFCLQGDRTTLI